MIDPIVDTHAHYDDDAFDSDRDSLLRHLPECGVRYIIDCGCSESSCRSALRLAQAYPYVFAACGIHPEDCEEFGDPESLEDRLSPFWRHTKCVAIGEIGLDYHYDIDKELQNAFFEKQLQFSLKYDLPVIIHDREAHADTFNLLRKYRPRGVLHCFSGSAEMAKEAVKMGLYIGFGGAVTFKNARRALEAAAAIPTDRLLLETDCPYMAPVPYRGKRCDSSMIPLAAEKIAEVLGKTTHDVLETAFQNAVSLFGIADKSL